MSNVVILAGGRGSRLGEMSEVSPKPLVPIGEVPIIDHIINKFILNMRGCHFIVAGGYRCDLLHEHFDGDSQVDVVFTGKDSGSAGRLWRLRHLLHEPFYLCYGDGLTDFYLPNLEISTHIVNMLVVHPIGRFGEVVFGQDHLVTEFSEKPQLNRWINGGFFFCSVKIMDYIQSESDDLAQHVLPRLVKDGELMCVPYDGYWHCMDTPRDWAELNTQYNHGDAKWLK